MAYRNVRYVHEYTDRHGRKRIYYNRPGYPKVPLRGPTGSKEFLEDYHEAEKGAVARKSHIGADRVLPGSLDDLIVRYYSDPLFLDLKETTRVVVRRQLDKFRSEANRGRLPIHRLERRHIRDIHAAMMDRKGAANNLLKRLKVLTRFAVEIGMLKVDPLARMRGFKYETASFRKWTDDDLAQFKAKHPFGSTAHLAMTLMLRTGLRRSDAVKIGWRHVDDNGIATRQEETGEEVWIPFDDDLWAAIEHLPRNAPTFLMTEQGHPFTAKGFGNWMRKRCNEAGLSERSAHGLRKAATASLAEAGCTDEEIMSITGHKSAGQLRLYTKEVKKRVLARAAVKARAGAEKRTNSANPISTVSKTGT